MGRWTVAAACILSASTTLAALQPTLDRRAIEEAIFIGQSPIEPERARFHAPYRVRVGRAPVDWIDVITPFHRVELAAQASTRSGRRFGQREAVEVLQGIASQVDIVLELSFHPQNTFVGIPSYQVLLLGSDGARKPPQRVDLYPRFWSRPDATTPLLPDPKAKPVLGTGQPLLGGTVIAVFDGSTMDPKGRYQVLLMEGEAELARAALDFARMR